MIYVNEKKFERQFGLLELLSNSNPTELVVWIYPESTLGNLLGMSLYGSVEVNAEPVTTYEEGVIARCTARLPMDAELLGKLKGNQDVLVSHCDSLCVYLKGSFEWLACTIGHEGMGLVRDNDFMGDVFSSGFNASLEPPEWW